MQKNQKRLTACVFGTAAALFTAACAMMQASASGSVEDVYAAMRRIGLPESMVQEARIQYQNAPHDADGMEINGSYYTYDVLADLVELYEDDIWNAVGDQFGVSGSDIRDAVTATDPPQTETGTNTAPSAEPGSSTASQTTAAAPFVPSVVTEKPFVNMTLEEKRDYVNSLPESERAAFLASLTTTERNSILKQMDRDSQADIANSFVGLGESLGMHITVNEIGENGISYSVRDGAGSLIDSASVGVSVDDTGWNTTVPVLVSLAMIGGSIAGFYFISRKRAQS